MTPCLWAQVPSGLLPVLEVDGQVITESAVIQQVLEQMYPERPLLPPEGSPERSRAAQLMRLERRLFSDWLQVGGGLGRQFVGSVGCAIDYKLY